jgi:hypothetical protein
MLRRTLWICLGFTRPPLHVPSPDHLQRKALAPYLCSLVPLLINKVRRRIQAPGRHPGPHRQARVRGRQGRGSEDAGDVGGSICAAGNWQRGVRFVERLVEIVSAFDRRGGGAGRRKKRKVAKHSKTELTSFRSSNRSAGTRVRLAVKGRAPISKEQYEVPKQ